LYENLSFWVCKYCV